MSAVTLRIPTEEDLPALRELLLTHLKGSRYAGLAPNDDAYRAYLEASSVSPNLFIRVAMDKSGECVGYMTGAVDWLYYTSELCAVEHILVSTDPRAGHRLREVFNKWAKKRGACESFALTSGVHAPAERMDNYYKRLGYQAVGQVYRRKL